MQAINLKKLNSCVEYNHICRGNFLQSIFTEGNDGSKWYTNNKHSAFSGDIVFKSNCAFPANDPITFSGKIVCNNRIELAILCKRPGVNEGELSADWETMLFSRWIFSGLHLLQISQEEIDLRIINSTRI